MILMIDNYDSFTWNVVQYLWELGAEVEVHRNDEITLADIAQKAPAGLCISPGPCSPAEAGVSLAAITEFAGQIPIFGICLGQQSIGAAFGGEVVRPKPSCTVRPVRFTTAAWGCLLISQSADGDEYHSLVVDAGSLPDCLEVTAWTEGEHGEQEAIMGLRHREWDIEGVQFHPESILSEHGHAMLGRFLARCQ